MSGIEDVRRDVQELLDVLGKQNLLALPPNYPVRRAVGAREEISWTGASRSGLRGKLGRFATPSEYRSLIENRQYTAVLQDGAILMVSYLFGANGALDSHSLCYYPCPLDVDWETETNGPDPFVDVFDALLERELKCSLLERDIYEDTCESRILMRAPFRFDYAPQHAGDDHAASHVHIAHPDCRIPVFGPLSVGHFVRFVFGNYYRDWLELCQEFSRIPNRVLGREFLDAHEAVIHLNWLTTDERRRDGFV